MPLNNPWNRRNEASNWLTLLATVIIVYLTVVLVNLNRQRVYLAKVNIENTSKTAAHNAEILEQLRQINCKLKG